MAKSFGEIMATDIDVTSGGDRRGIDIGIYGDPLFNPEGKVTFK